MKIFSLINRISALTNFFSAGNTQKINSNLLKYGLVLLFSVTLWGCGKGNPAAVTIDPSTGKHATGWAVGAVGGSHVDAFFATKTVGSSCVGCHGTPQDPIGGIVKVSCSSVSRDGMNCHGGLWPHGDVPYIPQAFDTPTVHGQQVVNNGLATCQKCHGVDYKGLPGLGVNCIACHQTVNPANNAPHAFDWTTGTLVHSATNPNFAPACGECHYFPNNPASTTNTPRTVPNQTFGTTPTCFGATAMCHSVAGHAVPYLDKSLHGLAAHTSGPMFCATCHATGTPPRFTVAKNANLTPNGCENCHYNTNTNTSGLAHPYGWLPGRGTTLNVANTTSHTTANFGATGEQCSPCHTLTGTTTASPSPNAPSCMTQTAQIGGTTFCHFTASPVANPTGCRSCHGTTTTNGQPDGTAVPNRDFRHSAHFAATGLTGLTCAVCHTNKGTGTTGHSTIDLSVAANAAAVAIPGLTASPSYSDVNVNNGVSADAAYDPATQTCSNVSCHGGIPLVGTNYKWRSATQTSITGDTDCTRCHTVSRIDPAAYSWTPGGPNSLPYNGPFSGFSSVNSPNYIGAAGFKNLHVYHIEGQGLTCITCHDKTKAHSRMLQGARSIKGAGFAASTLKSSIITYAVSGSTSTCNAACHPGLRSWYK